MERYVTETSASKGGCYGYMRVLGHISNGDKCGLESLVLCILNVYKNEMIINPIG